MLRPGKTADTLTRNPPSAFARACTIENIGRPDLSSNFAPKPVDAPRRRCENGRMNKLPILALAALAAFHCLSAKQLNEDRLPSLQTGGVYNGNPAIRDVTYKVADGQVLQFDIAYPKAEAPKGGYPLIVYMHGGGWSGGNRFEGYGFFPDEITHYTSEGFAVATVSYRFINERRTIVECVEDVMDALRFMAKNAEALKINPEKIGVYGHSAGGHLAMMAALAGGDKFPGDPALNGVEFKVACAVPMSGPSSFVDPAANFANRPVEAAAKRFFGAGNAGPERMAELARLASPAEYVSKNSPPMLIIIGEKDSLVSKNSALYMEKLAKKTGAPFEIFIAPGAEHSFENGDHVEILKKRRAFFRKHLMQ